MIFPRCWTRTVMATARHAFDKIIAATNDHFWDPLDTRYIDFSAPFDIENAIYRDSRNCRRNCNTAVVDRLTEKQKIHLANRVQHYQLSVILHGEQARAEHVGQSVPHLLDPGAQEYCANQCREEARHVTGFTKYIDARFGQARAGWPVPARPAGGLLSARWSGKKSSACKWCWKAWRWGCLPLISSMAMIRCW